jgi:hypothetical protein
MLIWILFLAVPIGIGRTRLGSASAAKLPNTHKEEKNE